jgi:hypothetical protein
LRAGTLHVGKTGDLANRTWQHKRDLIDGLTKKYGVRPGSAEIVLTPSSFHRKFTKGTGSPLVKIL